MVFERKNFEEFKQKYRHDDAGTYYDKDSCIHVLRNYTLGEVYKYFHSICCDKNYNISYVGKKWILKIDGVENVLENENHIDLLIGGIEKLMEGS